MSLLPTDFTRLAGPYTERGRCVQRLCWGGVAVDCAPAGDGWEADVYAPGDLDGEPRGVRGRTLEEVQAYADQIAAWLGWEVVAATPERWAPEGAPTPEAAQREQAIAEWAAAQGRPFGIMEAIRAGGGVGSVGDVLLTERVLRRAGYARGLKHEGGRAWLAWTRESGPAHP